jgi:transcriptional regulator with XRE-family HTH domain
MADETLTLTAERILEAMDAKGYSIKDMADKTESTYEHMRKIVRGGNFPSKYMIRVLAETLDIKQSELQRLVVADQIRHKYGKIPAEISGKNPDLEPVERIWPSLTKDQQKSFIAQMQAVAKQNRMARAAAS